MTFAPATDHGPLEEVVRGVFTLRGTFRMAPGVVVSRTMTVVRQGGELVVFNSVRPMDPSVLDAVGRVAHVVKLADMHGLDDPWFVDHYRAAFWSAEGARHVLPRDRTLGPDAPVEGARVVRYSGTRKREVAVWIPHAGGTLVTCDAIQNHCDHHQQSFLARSFSPWLGFAGGVVAPWVWRQNQAVRGDALRAAYAGLRELRFENLVTGHGPAVVGGADERVRAAIEAVTR